MLEYIKKQKPPVRILLTALLLIMLWFVLRNIPQEDGEQYPDPTGVIASVTPVPEEAVDVQDEVEIKYYFRKEDYLVQHFQKHGAEFPYETAQEYLAGANRVVQSPDALHKLEAEDGDDVYYLEASNEFVIVSKDGYLRTYFKPDAGIDYYNRQ